MSFFAPLPEPKRESSPEESVPRAFVLPEWFGPPPGIIGADVGCTHSFFHDDRLCLRLDRVVLYPSGLTLNLELWMRQAPLLPGKEIGLFPWALVDQRGPHDRSPDRTPTHAADYLRVGVQYADGRRVATGVHRPDQSRELALAEDPPEELVLLPRGGSGDRRHHAVQLWLWPSPPSGPITLVVEWPSLQIPETRFDVAAAALGEARSGVLELWPG